MYVGFARSAIRGQLPLWKAFWLLFVPTPFILYLLYLGLLLLTPLASGRNPFVYALVFSNLAFGLMGVIAVIVWRCSRNSTRVLWRYAALLAVLAYVLWYGRRVSLLWGLALS